jgi:hypothetical protein
MFWRLVYTVWCWFLIFFACFAVVKCLKYLPTPLNCGYKSSALLKWSLWLWPLEGEHEGIFASFWINLRSTVSQKSINYFSCAFWESHDPKCDRQANIFKNVKNPFISNVMVSGLVLSLHCMYMYETRSTRRPARLIKPYVLLKPLSSFRYKSANT